MNSARIHGGLSIQEILGLTRFRESIRVKRSGYVKGAKKMVKTGSTRLNGFAP